METLFAAVLLVLAATGFILGFALSGGRSIAGICSCLGTAAVATPLLILVADHDRKQIVGLMAAEIGDPAYARIADMKGRSCAVDVKVAEAMRDGRITGAEYGPIMELAAEERLKGAKTAVASIAANASCATVAGRA